MLYLLIFVIVIVIIVASTLQYWILPAGLVVGSVGLILIAYRIYINIYFSGKKFKNAKASIDTYISNCNELNNHIEELKTIDASIKINDYGSATLSDNSVNKYSRSHWNELVKNNNTYNCSATICKNANEQPFKYLCKYFNIETTEESLTMFETLLNNFSAVEQGKLLLRDERDATIESIKDAIPSIIMYFSKKRIMNELGFNDIDFSELYFPSYKFQYVSAGGNSSMKCEIKLNIENLNKFVVYLNDLIKFKKSVAGQRALMTSTLRDMIKNRDNHTCKYCGVSAHSERNLLLEIDHIVPLSKGGITSVANLQTLCWKCNRAKGTKIISTNFSDSSVQLE